MFFDVNNLFFSYYRSPMTVKGAKFSFGENEKILVLASRGMGKSTLLKALSGFDETYLGSIKLCGRELKEIDDSEKNFSLLLDKPVFFERKSIKFNIDYLLKIIGKESLKEEMLFNLLAEYRINRNLKDKVSKLTLLEKRLLGMLRSSLKNPKILFLDDQFDGLNDDEAKVMIEVYEKIFDDKKSIICAFSDASFRKFEGILQKINFKKVLYLCDSELFVFSSVSGFENSHIRKNTFEFIQGYDSIDAIIYRTESSYCFCKEDVREFEIDKSLFKKLNELKLDVGDAEKVSVYYKGELDLENLEDKDLNDKFLKGELLVFSNLDGKKVF